jgi:hypothetical protein
MRRRSYLASVASPIGAGEAPAFPLYRPAPEEARAAVAEQRAVSPVSAASPPQTVRRKPAKASPAGEPFSIARAAEPAAAPGLTAPSPSATAPEAPIPDAPAPLATLVVSPAPSLQRFEPPTEPLADNRPEIAPFATSSFTPAPLSEAPAPVVFPAGDAPPLLSPEPGVLPAAASPTPNSESRAEIFGDEILAPAPRPLDPRAPLKNSDSFSPPLPPPSDPDSPLKIPRVEIGILEVRGAPAPPPPAPAPVAPAAPRPSGPVAHGYGWRYSLHQG